MAKGRSKSHPGLSLEEALTRARDFYDEHCDVKVSVEVAFQVWNYSEKSSGARRTLAALRAYGLTQEVGMGDQKKVGVSPLAMAILLDEPPTHPAAPQGSK